MAIYNTYFSVLGLQDSLGVLPNLGVLPGLGRLDDLGEYAFSPTSLFLNGEQGAWYDPSDLTTLFQDAAGTTAVTAVEQPVSLMLDKRLGGLNALGAELVTNTGGPYTSTTGFSAAGGATLSVSSGFIVITNGSYGVAQQTLTAASGRWFRISVNIGSGTAAQTRITFQYSQAGARDFDFSTGSGAKTIYVQSTVANPIIAVAVLSPTAGQTASFYSLSVKEVPGNHAYTPSSASTSRPVLSARVNFTTSTDAAATGLSVATVSGTGPAPLGTIQRITKTDATTPRYLNKTFSQTIAANTAYRLTRWVKYDGYDTTVSLEYNVTPNFDRNFVANFDVTTTGVVVNGTPSNCTASVEAFPDGWFRIICNVTAGAAPTGVNPSLLTKVTGASGTSVLMFGADFRLANDGVGIPSYQYVNTSTDYDTTGFPLYLRADGSDDYMLTSSIDFSATDKMTVVAGMRKLSDAAAGVFTELSSNFNNNSGSFIITIPDGANTRVYTAVRGTSVGYNTAYYTDTAAPITNINSIAFDKALSVDEVLYIRKNGSSQALTRDLNQNTPGNFDNYPLYLFRRNGTTAPFNGRFYGLVVRGAATDTATIQQTEAFLNNKTRAY